MTNKCIECEDRGYIFERFSPGINDKVPHPKELFVRSVVDEQGSYVSRAPCPECGRYVFMAVIWNRRTNRKELAECEELSDGNYITRAPSPHFDPRQHLLDRRDPQVRQMADGSIAVDLKYGDEQPQ